MHQPLNYQAPTLQARAPRLPLYLLLGCAAQFLMIVAGSLAFRTTWPAALAWLVWISTLGNGISTLLVCIGPIRRSRGQHFSPYFFAVILALFLPIPTLICAATVSIPLTR